MNVFRSLILIFLSLGFLITHGTTPDEYNIWYFGIDAGIDFNSGSAVSSPVNNFYIADNAATICSQNGSLFMYSNGEKAWNRNHQVMPNGNGLMGSTTGGQTALIIYRPYSKLYYLFTVPEFGTSAGLRYSIINMDADSSRGDIISKNNLLFTPSTEKMASIYDANNRSFWIITHELNSNRFLTYKLDSVGLDTVPVISAVGSSNTGGSYGYWHGAAGQLTVSYDGKKIANALNYSNEIELFDFDINTGIVSNPILISNVLHSWGVCFSPDCSKLYSTAWTHSSIWQYDLSNYTQAAIQSSKISIGTTTTPDPTYKAGYLQLAKDGKIYVAKFASTHLAVINEPNNSGSLCNFSDNGFYLGGKTSQAGLTTTVVFPGSIVRLNEIEKLYQTVIFPNPSTGYSYIQIPNYEFKINETQLIARNIFGQMTKLNYQVQKNLILIENSTLPKGVYFVEILSDSRLVSKSKMIIE